MKVASYILSFSLLFAAAAIPVSGEKLTRGISDVATITDGEGHSRILMHWDPATDEESIAISRALLTFPLTGEVEARTLSIRVHPISAPWSARDVAWSSGWEKPGGDFDPDVLVASDLDLSRGGGTVTLEVSDVLKEALEDRLPFHGLLITADPSQGVGLRDADAARFGDLAGASLQLSYRRVPTRPPGIAEPESVDVR